MAHARHRAGAYPTGLSVSVPGLSQPFVTWTLRILIVIDLAVVLILWPAVRNPARDVTLRMIIRQWIALPTAIAVAGFAWIVVNFPGEPHAEWTRYWESEKQQQAEVECRTMSPISIIFRPFDRLNLPRVDVVDDEKLEKIKEHTKAAGELDHQGERTRLLRGRDFNCADFSDYVRKPALDLSVIVRIDIGEHHKCAFAERSSNCSAVPSSQAPTPE